MKSLSHVTFFFLMIKIIILILFFCKQLIWFAWIIFPLPSFQQGMECKMPCTAVVWFMDKSKKCILSMWPKKREKNDDVTKNERSLFHVNGFQNGARNSSNANKQTFSFQPTYERPTTVILYFFLFQVFFFHEIIIKTNLPVIVLSFNSNIFIFSCLKGKNCNFLSHAYSTISILRHRKTWRTDISTHQ